MVSILEEFKLTALTRPRGPVVYFDPPSAGSTGLPLWRGRDSQLLYTLFDAVFPNDPSAEIL